MRPAAHAGENRESTALESTSSVETGTRAETGGADGAIDQTEHFDAHTAGN